MLLSDIISVDIIFIIFIVCAILYLFIAAIFDDITEEKVETIQNKVKKTQKVDKIKLNLKEQVKKIYINFYYYIVHKKSEEIKKICVSDFKFSVPSLYNKIMIPVIEQANIIIDDKLSTEEFIVEFISSSLTDRCIFIREYWNFIIIDAKILIKSILIKN